MGILPGGAKSEVRAGVVGCSNLTAGGHDVLTVELTKKLIARDILVLTAGCSSGGLENCGLMTPEAASLAGPKLRAVCESLGIPPVLNFGPCLAIGRLERWWPRNWPGLLMLSSLVKKVLTEDMKALTGGQIIVNSDADESADILEQIIISKRQALNI